MSKRAEREICSADNFGGAGSMVGSSVVVVVVIMGFEMLVPEMRKMTVLK